MVKRTLGGTKRKSVRVSGFRSRLKTTSGKKILRSRRKKKRQRLAKT